MSASDENQSDAKETTADDAGSAPGPTIEHEPADAPAPSSLGRKLKLYGALLGVLIVAVMAAAGTYPYWRGDAASALVRIGVDLENLEVRLKIPNWAITHGRETPAATSTASSDAPLTPDKTETAPKAAQSAAPATTITAPPPVSEKWREATGELADRLSSVEARLSRIEERLEALERAETDEKVASAAQPPPAAIQNPVDVAEQLETIAARLAELETEQKKLEAAATVPAQTADNGALIGTVVALAERVAAIEARGLAGSSELAALRDDTLALASRVAGFDDDLKQVGAALKEETPARDRAALLLLSVGQLSVATAGSGPYESQLEALRAVAGDQAGLADPLQRLTSHATTGAPTFVTLRAAFSEASSAVIRSRDVGPPKGVLGQTLSRVASLVTIRKVDNIGPGTVDGVLAAADVALGAGDLAAAVAVVEALEGAPGEAIGPWLSLARARLAVDRALSDLQASAIRTLAATG